MKNILSFRFVFFLLFVLAVLLLPLKSFAQSNFRQGETIVVEKDEIIDENYFAAGELVNVTGTINGDAYLAGGNVIVDGIVNGDVLAAGGTITIKGAVTGNVRLAGGQITISGNIGKNITAAGGQIIVSSSAIVAGSVTGGGGNIEVNAPIGGSIQVAAGTLSVTNSVPGNITFAGDKLWLSADAHVGGNVVYYSDTDAILNSGAIVSGELVKNIPPRHAREARESASRAMPSLLTFWTIVSFVSALLLGFILIRFAPNFTARVATRMNSHFLPSLGLGLLEIILIPAIILLLLLTVIGIPLSFIVFFGSIILLYISKLFAAAFLGQVLLRKALSHRSEYIMFLLGLIMYYIIGVIPIFGWLFQLILMASAMGALLAEKRDSYHTLAQKKLI